MTCHSDLLGIWKGDALVPQERKALPGSGEILKKQPAFKIYLGTPSDSGTIQQRNSLTLNTWVGG